MSPAPTWTAPDADGVQYRLVWTGRCSCAGWGGVCEAGCGFEIDDSRERRAFTPREETR